MNYLIGLLSLVFFTLAIVVISKSLKLNKNLNDEGIELLAAFVEVNGSFFVQKVLPLIKTLVEKQVAGLK